jgi:hypothetical protein
MSSKLADYLWEEYRVATLSIGDSRIQPGMIVDAEWPPCAEAFHLQPRLVEPKERAWETLQLSAEDFPIEDLKTSVVKKDTYGTVTVGGGGALPQFGIEFSGQLQAEYKGVVRLGSTLCRDFKDMTAKRRLLARLVALEKADPGAWAWIAEDLLVTESFYTVSLTAEFHSIGDLTAKAAFEKAGLKADGNLEIKWKNDSTFELIGAANGPFGVRGYRINKHTLHQIFD